MGKQFMSSLSTALMAGDNDYGKIFGGQAPGNTWDNFGRALFGGGQEEQIPQGNRTTGFGGGPNPDGSMSYSGGQQQPVDENGIPIGSGPGIDVTGGRPGADLDRPYEYDIPGLNNSRLIMDVEEANKQGQIAQNAKGPFGIKGTFRDILGTIGDALLISGGADRIYAPKREQEKMAAAMAGFTQNQQAAIERMAAINPAAAQEMAEKLAQQRYQQGVLENQRVQQQSLDANRKATQGRYLRQQIANLFNSPAAQANPEQALQYAMSAAANANFSLEELGISPDMSSEEMAAWANFNFPVGQQVRAEQGERRLDQGEERIEISRNRPGPRPRAETDSERYIRIGNTPKAERSAGEQAWYEQKSKGTRREPKQPRQPGSEKNRFRTWTGNQ